MQDVLKLKIFRFLPLTASLILFIFSLFSLLIIDQNGNFLFHLGFSKFWLIIFCLFAYIVFSLLSFYLNFKLRQFSASFSFFACFLQSLLITIACLVYYLRFNNSSFRIANFVWNNHLIYISLAIVIFLTNFYLLIQAKCPFWLLFIQIVILSLSSFSFLNFINFDRTFLRFFTYQILEQIFSLPDSFWLFLTSSVISFFSIWSIYVQKTVFLDQKDSQASTLSKRNFKKKLYLLYLFLLLSFCHLQILMFLNNLNFITYWYKTIAFVVFWDFLYKQLFRYLNQEFSNLSFRLSAFYHFSLFILILVLSFV